MLYQADLDAHIAQHFSPEESDFFCESCDFVVDDIETLNEHIADAHMRHDDDVYACRKCDFQSDDRAELIEHTLKASFGTIC
jgi:hypothetical protein